MAAFDAAWALDLMSRPGFMCKEPRSGTLSVDAIAARIATLFASDPALLLERYGALLAPSELQRFDQLASDYEVGWHLRQLQQSGAQRDVQRRNRRLRALEELERHGEFFSDSHIQRRAPRLYHQYIGRFLPAERSEAFDEHCTLSERLLANMDADDLEQQRQMAEAAARAERQQEKEEEDDDDDDVDDVDEQIGAKGPRQSRSRAPDGAGGTSAQDGAYASAADDDASDYESLGFQVLEEERRQRAAAAAAANGQSGTVFQADTLDSTAADAAAARVRSAREERTQRAREELLRLMRERFLDGMEADFYDYEGLSDNNPRFDDVEQQARDAEERWFDED
jgi:hypothetical protein